MDLSDEDLLLPPPSYYEQEFDTKISQATDLSLQSSRREAQLVIDEDGWPRYDPAMFEEESIPSMKGKEYSATSFTSAESSSGVKKRPLPDISSIKPSTIAGGPSNIPQTAPLHIAKKSILQPQEAALETKATAFQFASNPLQPDPSLTLENTTTGSVSDHQTADVPLYSYEYSNGVPDITGGTPTPEQHARQVDSRSGGTEETESSDTLMSEPLDVNTSTGQWDGSHRSVGDLKYPVQYPAVQYPAVQYLPNRQSMPPQNLSRISPPEFQRSQSASYVPTFSQPAYQPLVSFNPNVAYGAPSMASGPPPTIRPRQPSHKVSFPLQYDPHALYNSSVSSRLKTTPNQPSYSSYQQTRLGNDQTFVSTNTSLNPVGRSMRHSSARPLSTFSTMSDASYSGAVPGTNQYPSYSNRDSYAMPEDQQWYINR